MTDAKVILDTDIGPDCDDAGAVAVLNALADLGEVEILGMTCCTSSQWGAPCIQAINTYYGRSDVPVGTRKKPGLLEEDRWSFYNKYVAQHFPNNLRRGANAPDAVRLMRHILARNRKITIVGIGPLANLADLLGSLPDDISPKPGRELIAGSVDTLVQMGGGFPEGEKFNFQTHPSAAREVVNKWPTPILFSGKEVGGRISAGEQLLRTPRTNPVRMAYKLHTQGWMKGFGFDHTAVLYAVRGLSDYWNLSDFGRCFVDEKGKNTWASSWYERHRYLIARKAPEEMAQIIEKLMAQYPKLARHESDPMEDEEVIEELPVAPDKDP